MIFIQQLKSNAFLKEKNVNFHSKQINRKLLCRYRIIPYLQKKSSFLPVGKNHDFPDLRVAAFRTFQSLKRKTKSQNGDAQSLLYLLSLA